MRFVIGSGALIGIVGVALGCSGGSTTTSSSTSPDGGGPGGQADAGTTDDAAPPVTANAKLGTYIALGDSISDRGGVAPFFYDLLLKNDDAAYPGWKGKDLTTRYPGIQYVHGAVAGAVTGPYTDRAAGSAPKLTDQIKKLGSAYPGDVLVTITIGGNDLNDHAGDAVTNVDGPDKTQFTANLQAVLAELSTPGRLGAGKVYIVEANIYDASDGKGNWLTGGPRCPPFNTGPKLDLQVFDAWNGIINTAITATPNDTLLDIRKLFDGHGFNSADNWYFTDCIHPNAKGHHHLRREAWRAVTGEAPTGDE